MAAELEPAPATGFPFPVPMEEQDPAGKVPPVVQAGTGGSSPRRAAPQQVKQEPPEEPVQRWEIQWQEVMQASDAKLPSATPSPEMWRRRFRGFRYQEGEGPREVCSRLRELCQRWLEPQHRSKEQMLELVVLEQFLAILPQEMQSQEWGRGVETCAEAVTLAEGFQLQQPEDETFHVTVRVKVEEVASDIMTPTGALQEPLDSWVVQPQPHPAHVSQEEAGQGESPEPQEELPHVPKEEPAPHQEPDSPDTEETWDSSADESSTSWFTKRDPSPGAEYRGLTPDLICRIQRGEAELWVCEDEDRGESSGSEGPSAAGAWTLIRAAEQPPEEVPANLELLRTFPGRLGEKGPLRPEPGRLQKRLHGPQKQRKNVTAGGRESETRAEPKRSQGCREELRDAKRGKTKLHQRVRRPPKRPTREQELAAKRQEKAHPCPECGKVFEFPSHLALHKRVHTGEKPHQCPECGKSFNHPYHLAQHRRIHSGDMPYRCAQCGKGFICPSYLTRHQRVHAQEDV
ncbi:zinc finger and SCAN domain-containing protein 29 isoform X1 [Alligator mississippiensis]|uniref:zinc finger and SCAN domain-containing protein 29 isoform X1 n=1 Tax=Alligator mississippiensis TaxID=8496 RepID=UPI0006EC5C6A|nr:zinc finger and SCAN domain-containing protein 29 isoform X1 [Alligator mississippiensis]XP_019351876.1 zinc finger and SCAN domain-containing protein 29 isoform X1 [Alligator mississippiensis]XP_059587446.1 zinc finger and SCAN domain-containing protein 29 isoform X1 [Alligator mississippiensis]